MNIFADYMADRKDEFLDKVETYLKTERSYWQLGGAVVIGAAAGLITKSVSSSLMAGGAVMGGAYLGYNLGGFLHDCYYRPLDDHYWSNLAARMTKLKALGFAGSMAYVLSGLVKATSGTIYHGIKSMLGAAIGWLFSAYGAITLATLMSVVTLVDFFKYRSHCNKSQRLDDSLGDFLNGDDFNEAELIRLLGYVRLKMADHIAGIDERSLTKEEFINALQVMVVNKDQGYLHAQEFLDLINED